MTVQELKSGIVNKTLPVQPSLFVFKYTDTPFVCNQYIKHLSRMWAVKLEFIDTLDPLIKVNNIFDTPEVKDNTCYIYKVDTLDTWSKKLETCNNLIIVTKKISKDVESNFSPYLVSFDILQEWQIKDYMYGKVKGVERSNLDWLYSLCKGDINRIELETDKFINFGETEQKFLFEDCKREGAFSDLSSFDIFNLTNAIMKRDVSKVRSIYAELNSIDVEPIGLLTLLYNNFKNIILIQLNPRPTEENTGLSQKQINAIKYSCGYYSTEQVVSIFKFLSMLDCKIKKGEMPIEILVDYMLTKILMV